MKKWILLFLALSALNGFVFIFRESFQYTKYSTYADLYAACDAKCRDKWDDYMRPYSAASIAEARRLLMPLGLDLGTSLSKITAISNHLYTRFHKQGGYPQDTIHRSEPVLQYKILSADTTQRIWCGTYAQMFSFFCWSQNIVCRNLEINKPGDHHILNECYLPEINQWVMVDVTNNTAAAALNDKLLNTQDFVKALQAPASLLILTAGDTTWSSYTKFKNKNATDQYYQNRYAYHYYNATQPAVLYRPAAKLKRYFLPDYWYEIYSPTGKTNILFYGKLFLAVLWLTLAGTIIFKFFIK
ncbi:MAG TPA: hypothetical protein VM871_06070 [Flavisolibacter sp.]|nr:hypothetical protein [Flavisolibacter sp.]